VRLALLALLALLIAALPLRAEEPATGDAASPYRTEVRVRGIAAALEAMRSIDDARLLNAYRYLLFVERSQCRAPLLSLKIECLMEAATRNCRTGTDAQRRVCQTVSDVLISNRLGEDTLISQEEKLDLMKAQGKGTFRERFERELRRRYANLALEMSLKAAPDELEGEQLAQTIESYCRRVSSTREVAWQHCASAIVWFVATSERPNVPGKEER